MINGTCFYLRNIMNSRETAKIAFKELASKFLDMQNDVGTLFASETFSLKEKTDIIFCNHHAKEQEQRACCFALLLTCC